MKLTTGILISILMAGNAMAQQAATPSFWDTLRAKIMGAPAPKPSAQHPASANPQAAKPAAASNAKPSPVQPKGAAPVTSASKTQAQPTQVQPTQVQPIKGQAANSASASVATKNQVPQNAQVQPAKAPATKAAVIPVVAAKPAELKTHEAATGDLKKEVLQKVAANSKAEETKASETKAKNADKPADAKAEVAVEDSKTAANTKSATKEFSYTGQRDPFISPVRTAAAGGSGCSTGKRCLAVDQINLKGVIKSDGGMIAVVTNSVDKAYFLRENDPVFNGYVVKITGDSVVFSETYEDKLGKPLTREVTKKLTTPAV
jgi:Tfp pilus assembly protein PilP